MLWQLVVEQRGGSQAAQRAECHGRHRVPTRSTTMFPDASRVRSATIPRTTVVITVSA